MDKESIIELQKIDCNCNNCGYMVRDFEKFKQSAIDRDRWQHNTFYNTKGNTILKAWGYLRSAEVLPQKEEKFFRKAANLLDIASKMKYKFQNDSFIIFATCGKFNKQITFIPETCQIETQNCFVHRKEMNNI